MRKTNGVVVEATQQFEWRGAAYKMGWRLAPLISNTSLNKKSPLTSHEICCITSLSEQP